MSSHYVMMLLKGWIIIWFQHSFNKKSFIRRQPLKEGGSTPINFNSQGEEWGTAKELDT